MARLVNKVRKTIQQFQMLVPGDHVVVGVSGGADSVCLLTVLHELQEQFELTLTAAHFDHGLRGEDSRREADFVQEVACRLGLDCVMKSCGAAGDLKNGRGSLQEAARDVRYAFFREVMQERGATRIATGHHADDQAETVLMWFLRGTSLRGLSGIPPVREGVYIRPLIHISREEIEVFLQHRDISYVPDMSAGELHYHRNRIRHRLVPLLRSEYNPNIVGTLGSMADLVRGDDAVLERLASEALSEILIARAPCQVSISREGLEKFEPAVQRRVIRQIVVEARGDTRRLSSRHIDAVCRLITSSGPSRQVQLPGGWRFWREYGRMVCARQAQNKTTYRHCFEALPAVAEIQEIGKRIYFTIESPPPMEKIVQNQDPFVAFLNYDMVDSPLTVRNWQPGDRFRPLGLGGSKKVKNAFADAKIPLRQRYRMPVVLCGDKVVWVSGVQIDELFKVSADTKRALRVRIETMSDE